MTTLEKIPVSIYTEMTPNPETMKFVSNRMLLQGANADFPDETTVRESPLAAELFGFPFVKGVFIMNNFVTVTKQQETGWEEIIPVLKEFINGYLADGKPAFTEQFKPESTGAAAVTVDADSSTADETEIEAKIKEILEQRVKPAVAMDGGAIHFKSYKDGKVTVVLKGSCSGCPSATITLKAGVERILKSAIPEVKEVVAKTS